MLQSFQCPPRGRGERASGTIFDGRERVCVKDYHGWEKYTIGERESLRQVDGGWAEAAGAKDCSWLATVIEWCGCGIDN
jgi:hypothetical protein